MWSENDRQPLLACVEIALACSTWSSRVDAEEIESRLGEWVQNFADVLESTQIACSSLSRDGCLDRWMSMWEEISQRVLLQRVDGGCGCREFSRFLLLSVVGALAHAFSPSGVDSERLFASIPSNIWKEWENWFSIESINMESDHVSEKIFLIDDILSVSDAAQEIVSMMSEAGHPLRFVDLLISSLHPQSPAKNTDLFISRFSVTSRILAWILSVFSSNQNVLHSLRHSIIASTKLYLGVFVTLQSEFHSSSEIRTRCLALAIRFLDEGCSSFSQDVAISSVVWRNLARVFRELPLSFGSNDLVAFFSRLCFQARYFLRTFLLSLSNSALVSSSSSHSSRIGSAISQSSEESEENSFSESQTFPELPQVVTSWKSAALVASKFVRFFVSAATSLLEKIDASSSKFLDVFHPVVRMLPACSFFPSLWTRHPDLLSTITSEIVPLCDRIVKELVQMFALTSRERWNEFITWMWSPNESLFGIQFTSSLFENEFLSSVAAGQLLCGMKMVESIEQFRTTNISESRYSHLYSGVVDVLLRRVSKFVGSEAFFDDDDVLFYLVDRAYPMIVCCRPIESDLDPRNRESSASSSSCKDSPSELVDSWLANPPISFSSIAYHVGTCMLRSLNCGQGVEGHCKLELFIWRGLRHSSSAVGKLFAHYLVPYLLVHIDEDSSRKWIQEILRCMLSLRIDHGSTLVIVENCSLCIRGCFADLSGEAQKLIVDELEKKLVSILNIDHACILAMSLPHGVSVSDELTISLQRSFDLLRRHMSELNRHSCEIKCNALELLTNLFPLIPLQRRQASCSSLAENITSMLCSISSSDLEREDGALYMDVVEQCLFCIAILVENISVQSVVRSLRYISENFDSLILCKRAICNVVIALAHFRPPSSSRAQVFVLFKDVFSKMFLAKDNWFDALHAMLCFEHFGKFTDYSEVNRLLPESFRGPVVTFLSRRLVRPSNMIKGIISFGVESVRTIRNSRKRRFSERLELEEEFHRCLSESRSLSCDGQSLISNSPSQEELVSSLRCIIQYARAVSARDSSSMYPPDDQSVAALFSEMREALKRVSIPPRLDDQETSSSVQD